MDNRVPMLLGALAGAVVGAVCGYLYFTDDGRRLRADLEPTLNDLTREFNQARAAASRARTAVSEVTDYGFPN